MSAILRDEIERTRASLETQRRDSRLGYEWEQDYFYTPYVLEEKLKLLQVTLEQQIPDWRRSHSLPYNHASNTTIWWPATDGTLT
jgi:hypothetical protein